MIITDLTVQRYDSNRLCRCNVLKQNDQVLCYLCWHLYKASIHRSALTGYPGNLCWGKNVRALLAPLKEWMCQDVPSALWTSFQQGSGCLRKVDSTTRMWVDGFPDVHSLINLSTSFSPWDTSRESSQGRHRNNLSRNMAWKFCHFSCLAKKWSVCCSVKLCHIV